MHVFYAWLAKAENGTESMLAEILPGLEFPGPLITKHIDVAHAWGVVAADFTARTGMPTRLARFEEAPFPEDMR